MMLCIDRPRSLRNQTPSHVFVPCGITRLILTVTQTSAGAALPCSPGTMPTSFVFVLDGTAARDHRRTKTFQSTEAIQ
jgi:hypothetical protein